MVKIRIPAVNILIVILPLQKKRDEVVQKQIEKRHQEKSTADEA